VEFYERGLDTPSHQFLHSLLQYYGLVMHILIPSRILHIAAFMTLCEAYLGVDSEFDLWSYFFDVRHPHDLDVELTVFGGAIIHVKYRNGVGPYFNLPMPRSMKGWQKKWFYLRNNASAPLPVFMGSCPIPLLSWGG
jgi:hypothetical protein